MSSFIDKLSVCQRLSEEERNPVSLNDIFSYLLDNSKSLYE